jgi:tetratricopeptide (TPR) repeat protein
MLTRAIQLLDKLKPKASGQAPKQPSFTFRASKSEGNREKALQQLEHIITASPQRRLFEKFLAIKCGVGRISYETILDNIHKIVGDLDESSLDIALQRGLARELLKVQNNYRAIEIIKDMWSLFTVAAKERVLNELGNILNIDGIGLQVLLKEKYELSNRAARYLLQYAPQIAEGLEGVPETKILTDELLCVCNKLNNDVRPQQLLLDEATINLEETQTIRRQEVPEEEQTGVWARNAMSHTDTFSSFYEVEMQTFAGQKGSDVPIFTQPIDMVRNVEPGQVFYVENKLYGIREDHGRYFLWQGVNSIQEEIRVPGYGELASNMDFNEFGLSFFIARDDEGKLGFLLTCRSILNNDTEEIAYPFAQAV